MKGDLRIVAGTYRGRRLSAVDGYATRPTTERVREAVMSSLLSMRGCSFEGMRFLDAFAGTGAFGIEALSRGASFCLFVESGKEAFRTVRSNIESLRAPKANYALLNDDVMQSAAKGALPGGPFDIVFLDPPYALPLDEVALLVANLEEHGLIGVGGVVVYEHALDTVDDGQPLFGDSFEMAGTKRYGKTEVTVFRRHVPQSTEEGER